MNELKFLEVMGKIDNELIREAEIKTAEQPKTMRIISKRSVYAFGSVAAVAAIAVGSALFFNSYNPSTLVDNSIIQPDKNGDNLQNTEYIVSASSSEESKKDTNAVNSNSSNSTKPKDEKDHQDTNEVNSESSKSTKPKDEKDHQNTKEVNSESSKFTKPKDEKDHSVNDVSEQPSTEVTNQDVSSIPNDNSTPQITESKPEHNPDTQSMGNYYQPFSATIDPDVDSFVKDELQHIDIRTSKGFYHQLSLDEYASNGISSTVSTTEFGEYIGKIIEVNDYDYYGNAAESQEPTLAGAEVYYYAPKGNNKAFIIVKQNDQCSIFIADEINTSEGFRNGLSFFNVQGAEDIESVWYQKRIPDDDGKMIISEQSIITDNTKVAAFYDLICQLKPEDYSGLPEFAATPQWYIDAWDKYKADPDAFVMEDYSIIITLKDGTVLHEIRYQPFLGNGYVENMQELTPRQNSALKNLLR